MTEVRSVLERARANFPAPDLRLDDILLRRERKQRNQRVAAGIVGLLIAIAVAAGGAALLRSDGRPAVDERSSLPPLLREGEVMTSRRGWFVAFNPTTETRRRLVEWGCGNPNRAACNMLLHHYRVSADGRWIAYELTTCIYTGPCNPDAGVWVANALGDQHQVTAQCGSSDGCHEEAWAWSSQGASLAVAESSEGAPLVTIDPWTDVRTTITEPGVGVDALAWSPDDSSIAYAGNEVEIVDVATREVTTITGLLGETQNVVWSPDGSTLALDDAIAGDYRILLAEADGSGLRVLADHLDAQIPSGAPAWSPDGKRIAFVAMSEVPGVRDSVIDLWVMEVDGSSERRLFHDGCCSISEGPAWSPDGTRIAFFDGESRGWVVVNADGTGEPEPIDEVEVERGEPGPDAVGY